MSEMVERVAIAIIGMFPQGDGESDGAWAVARAAIEAMREPTEEMMRYAEGNCDFILPDAVGDNTPEGRVAEFTTGYKIAIAVALGEYPKPQSRRP